MSRAEQIAKAIPAKFVMISGSEDKQTSADVFNVSQFELPHPAGKAGGACTSSLLNVLGKHPDGSLTWLELLHKMRTVLKQKVSSLILFSLLWIIVPPVVESSHLYLIHFSCLP
jgi:hypothetical protein